MTGSTTSTSKPQSHARQTQGHTPGPHDVLGTTKIGGEFEFTVIGRRMGDDETLTTAYVNLPQDVPLYTAAPDMLAALKELVEKCSNNNENGYFDCWDNARAAIAKATVV